MKQMRSKWLQKQPGGDAACVTFWGPLPSAVEQGAERTPVQPLREKWTLSLSQSIQNANV